MKHASALQAILANDPGRYGVLATVGSLGLPDCWVGAGFIRNAVWDYLHDRAPSRHTGDVDVVWFCPERARPAEDKEVEAALRVSGSVGRLVGEKPGADALAQRRRALRLGR